MAASASSPRQAAQQSGNQRGVIRKNKKRRLPQTVSREEAAAIFGQLDLRTVCGLRDRCMYELMYRAGLRVSETCDLEPRDVDTERGRVRIVDGKGGDGTAYFDPASVSPLIEEWKRTRRRLGFASSPYLFCTIKRTNTRLGGPVEPGGRLSPRHLEGKLKRLAKRAGMDPAKVWPHVLRHTFATEILEERGNVRQVQKLLRHRNLATTEIYTHVVDTDLEDTVHKRAAKRVPVRRGRPAPSAD